MIVSWRCTTHEKETTEGKIKNKWEKKKSTRRNFTGAGFSIVSGRYITCDPVEVGGDASVDAELATASPEAHNPLHSMFAATTTTLLLVDEGSAAVALKERRLSAWEKREEGYTDRYNRLMVKLTEGKRKIINKLKLN